MGIRRQLFYAILAFCVILTTANGWSPRIDLAILIDASDVDAVNTSETTPPWLNVTTFCKDLVRAFNVVGPTGARLALIELDRSATIRLHWGDCYNSSSILDALTWIENRTLSASAPDLTAGLLQYNDDLYGERPDNTNFIVLILRGKLEQNAAAAASAAVNKFRTEFIVLDVRPSSMSSQLSVEKILGTKATTFQSLDVDRIVERIKTSECTFRLKAEPICYYVDASRQNCVSAGINESYRPADWYGYNESCTGRAPKRPPAQGPCPIEHCDRTCDEFRPWSACAEYECDENTTVVREPMPSSGVDARLGNCLEEKILNCDPCNTTPLSPTTVQVIIGVRIALFLTVSLVAFVMVVVNVLKRPAESEPQQAGSSADFSPKSLTPSFPPRIAQ